MQTPRAIIVATGGLCQPSPLDSRFPAELLLLGDRPFLQHIIERLVAAGITQMDIILGRLADRVEGLLGTGERWGCRFSYHLARDPARPYRTAGRVLAACNGPTWLAHGHSLPVADLASAASAGPLRITAAGAWTGWAILPPDGLAAAADSDYPELGRAIMGQDMPSLECQEFLSVETLPELIRSQGLALSGRAPGLIFSPIEVESGVWLARNVVLHPTAKLNPPVMIGRNARIGPACVLGPNANIAAETIVDAHTTVTDSVIFHGSYVGEALEVNRAIIDRGSLVNVDSGVQINVREEFLLGDVKRASARASLLGLLSRVAALVLLLIFLPVLLTEIVLALVAPFWFRFGRVGFIVIPADDNPELWKTVSHPVFHVGRSASSDRPGILEGFRDVVCRFIPGLLGVVLGRVRFVGVAPRSADDVAAMSEDWRGLYLRGKAGLITESFVAFGSQPSEDELYAAESFYVSKAGFLTDLRLVGGYIQRLFQPLSRTLPSHDDV